jgi:hypothetical protein
MGVTVRRILYDKVGRWCASIIPIHTGACPVNIKAQTHMALACIRLYQQVRQCLV